MSIQEFTLTDPLILFFSLGCSGDEQDLSVKATAVCSVYEKPILVNKPLHKGTLES